MSDEGGKTIKISGPIADPHIVRKLTRAILKAYEAEINELCKIGTVDFVDGFMAIHNAHVMIVESLIEESGSDLWRDAAIATLKNRLENPGDLDTKPRME